jgi:hypothetical protein
VRTTQCAVATTQIGNKTDIKKFDNSSFRLIPFSERITAVRLVLISIDLEHNRPKPETHLTEYTAILRPPKVSQFSKTHSHRIRIFVLNKSKKNRKKIPTQY